MKTFKKYSHIENSYQQAYINKVLETVGNDALFVAQEKVDGTNFQFIVGRNESGIVEVSCGKRSAEIAPDENFFGWQNIAAVMQEKIIKLFEILEKTYNVSAGVNINGEYFGGYYPGFKNTDGAILNRIAYSPKREFYGFDIYIPADETYLSPVKSVELFNEVGIFAAENLFIGTLTECLKLDPVFESTIATRLGYDKIDGNVAEGYVLKPVEPAYFRNGERIIIKHKNPKFQEVQKSRKVPAAPVENSEALSGLLTIIADYVNEARLENCKSHLGEIEIPKDFGKLLGELSKDVMSEFFNDEANKNTYTTLEKAEQKRFNGEVNKLCSSLIKEVYMTVKN